MTGIVGRISGMLVGGCDLRVDGQFAARCRCWLDLDQEEFAVEDPDRLGINAGEDRITFQNLMFPTQTGELRAGELRVSFARSRPHMGGMDVTDTVVARTFDFLSLAPVWRFACNEPVEFITTNVAEEVFLRPGKRSFSRVDLDCGGQLIGADHGMCVVNCPDFGEAHKTALELAVGCPLQECARQSGNRLTLWLSSWKAGGNFCPLFDAATDGGFVSNEKREAGIMEVYRAALSFQQQQPDFGRAFRLAIASYLQSRSFQIGYTLRMLAVMHLLEWLDGANTLDARVLVRTFGLKDGVAKAVMVLRNQVSHNHHDAAKRTDLLTSVEKACRAFEKDGIDLAELGQGDRELGLLNYHFSLVGKLLLERIGADVVPVLFLPGYGRFSQ